MKVKIQINNNLPIDKCNIGEKLVNNKNDDIAELFMPMTRGSKLLKINEIIDKDLVEVNGNVSLQYDSGMIHTFNSEKEDDRIDRFVRWEI